VLICDRRFSEQREYNRHALGMNSTAMSYAPRGFQQNEKERAFFGLGGLAKAWATACLEHLYLRGGFILGQGKTPGVQTRTGPVRGPND